MISLKDYFCMFYHCIKFLVKFWDLPTLTTGLCKMDRITSFWLFQSFILLLMQMIYCRIWITRSEVYCVRYFDRDVKVFRFYLTQFCAWVIIVLLTCCCLRREKNNPKRSWSLFSSTLKEKWDDGLCLGCINWHKILQEIGNLIVHKTWTFVIYVLKTKAAKAPNWSDLFSCIVNLATI